MNWGRSECVFRRDIYIVEVHFLEPLHPPPHNIVSQIVDNSNVTSMTTQESTGETQIYKPLPINAIAT